MKKQVMVRCSCCNGTGKMTLSEPMLKTLGVLNGHPMSTNDVFTKVGDPFVKITAINNRLNALLGMELVRVELRGKAKYWRKS